KIAWTVFFAVLAVAFVVLWALSYLRRLDFGSPAHSLILNCGQLFWCSDIAPSGSGISFDISPPDDMFLGRLGFLMDLQSVWGFGAASYSGRSVVTVPFWFVTLLSALLDGLPWLSSLPRSSRFSLRTLLIATTLVAVVLGLIVWAARG